MVSLNLPTAALGGVDSTALSQLAMAECRHPPMYIESIESIIQIGIDCIDYITHNSGGKARKPPLSPYGSIKYI